MRLLQIILIGLTAFSGCAKKADNNNITIVSISKPDSVKSMANTDSITYLALGDSYTIGESVPLTGSYPYQLTGLLRANSFNVQTPTIIAITGWTTADLIGAIQSSNITNKKFSFVTLLIGVNDQYQNKSQSGYRTDFAQVLNTAINCANGDSSKVFVLSIPDYGVTPFAAGQDAVIGPLIDQFNAINKDESQKRGVNYLDITDISRLAATDPSLIAADGLHPSAIMYGKWMLRLEPFVAAQLKKAGH